MKSSASIHDSEAAMLILLLSICLADEPDKTETAKEDAAQTVVAPAQVADQLSDILAMLQAIPTVEAKEDDKTDQPGAVDPVEDAETKK